VYAQNGGYGPGLKRALTASPKADVAARAPGRANLIGEHTDYNEGFVLPIALDMNTYVVGRRFDSVRLASLDEPEVATVDVETGVGTEEGWGRYVAAVVNALLDAGHYPLGLDGVVASDVPVGAGLSSSAALEVAIATILAPGLGGLELAKICRRAENHYVGVACGLMDQLTATHGAEGNALLIDCRTNEVQQIPMPESIAVLVIDSADRRDLADSAYNDRVTQCNRAARALGVASLRDATHSDLARLDGEPLLKRRARHIISENGRVQEAAEALRDGNLAELSELFRASHQSYAEDFEASTQEIDRLVTIADETKGVIGARLTGGGFGGCAVVLVASERARAAAQSILRAYRSNVGLEARAWVTTAGPGAGFIQLRTPKPG
jgi:galactokinase